MEIWDVPVPMGPAGHDQIRQLLTSHLSSAEPDLGEAVRATAARVHRELDRLPWASSFLAWFKQAGEETDRALVSELQSAVKDGRYEVAHGALLLLMALADLGQPLDDFLFSIAEKHPVPELQGLAGAYLLATGRTRERALRAFANHALLASTVQRELTTEKSSPAWRHLLGGPLGESDQEAAFIVIRSGEPFLFDLENGFLTIFAGADPAQRSRLVGLLVKALQSRVEPVQVFAFDLLTASEVLDVAQQVHGYRLFRVVQTLANAHQTPVRIRHYAARLLAALEAGVTTEDVRLAVRGQGLALVPEDLQAMAEIVENAGVWFKDRAVAEFATVQAHDGWDYRDYAHAVLTEVLANPQFPVPVEAICERLGIALAEGSFEGTFDALLLQTAHMPGPIAALNTRVGSVARRRFTIAHEIAHAVLPSHTGLLFDVATVLEAATAPDQSEVPHLSSVAAREAAAAGETPGSAAVREMEREADRFAAALLMPSRWFGPDAQKESFTLEGLSRLAERYGVSLTAAAFSAVRYARTATALVYSVAGEVRARWVTDEWRDLVGQEVEVTSRVRSGSLAFGLLHSAEAMRRRPASVASQVWFDAALPTLVLEQSIRTHAHHILTILEPMADEA